MAYIHHQGYVFWDDFRDFGLHVAKNFGMRLSVINTDYRRDALAYTKKLASMEDKPQYILFHYRSFIGAEMLKQIDAAGIRAVVVNTDVPEKERGVVGEPRGLFPSWIAHMYPDDKQAGYLLGKSLLEQREFVDKKHGITRNKVAVVAVGGGSNTTVSKYRTAGLNDIINSDKRAFLRRLLNTNWEYDESMRSTYELLNVYPDISVFWGAGDVLAIAGIEAMQKHNLQLGKDIVVGGIDWSKPGIQAVANGQMATTVGGHFMEGGWALVLIYDYHHGIDFESELGTKINLPMQVIDAKNVERYQKIFGDQNWKNIDYRQFSKVHNKSLNRYDFSLDKLFDAYSEIEQQSASVE